MPESFKTLTAKQYTEGRLQAIKDNLKELGIKNWRQAFVRRYPEYDTMKAYHHISNVLAGRQVDFLLLQNLERFITSENQKHLQYGGQPSQGGARTQVS